MSDPDLPTTRPPRASGKEIIGPPLELGGRTLSLSRAVAAGDFVYLTGQVPLVDGAPMTDASIEDQTRVVIESIRETLAMADCSLDDVVKTMVWLSDRADFPGFNDVYGEYFSEGPPARSALVSDFLIDIKVEIECIAYRGPGRSELGERVGTSP